MPRYVEGKKRRPVRHSLVIVRFSKPVIAYVLLMVSFLALVPAVVQAIELTDGELLVLNQTRRTPAGQVTCVVSKIDRTTGNQTVVSSFNCLQGIYGWSMTCRNDQLAVNVDGQIYEIESPTTVRAVAYISDSLGRGITITSTGNYMVTGPHDLRLVDRLTGRVLKRVDFHKSFYSHGDIYSVGDLIRSASGDLFAFVDRVCDGGPEGIIVRVNQTTLQFEVVAQQAYCHDYGGFSASEGAIAVDAAGVFLLEPISEDYLLWIDQPIGYQAKIPIRQYYLSDILVDTDGAVIRTAGKVYRINLATGEEAVLSQPGAAVCLVGASGTTPIPGTTVPTTTTTMHTTTTVAHSSSSTSSTLVGAATTSTTLPACVTASCLARGAVLDPHCAGLSIPAGIGNNLQKAVRAAEQAAQATGKSQRKLQKKAKRALGAARRKANRLSRGKQPKLDPECATAIQNAIALAQGSLAAGQF